MMLTYLHLNTSPMRKRTVFRDQMFYDTEKSFLSVVLYCIPLYCIVLVYNISPGEGANLKLHNDANVPTSQHFTNEEAYSIS